MLSADQKTRILEAIAECEAFIAKETPRRAEFRPADAQQYLEFCHDHICKLRTMLDAA